MVVCHNYEYVDGDPDIATLSEHLQNRRKIDKIPRSFEWLRLVNLGSDEEETIFLTMELHPSLCY